MILLENRRFYEKMVKLLKSDEGTHDKGGSHDRFGLGPNVVDSM